MAIYLPFKKLTRWQHIVFSAALLERMLPNYQLFSEHTQFGDFSILRNQLDLIWQWLANSKSCKINYNVQIEKLEAQAPDPEQFDFFGVFPALDTAMALMSLLQAMQNPDSDELLTIGKLSENSVNFFVELQLIERQNNDLTAQNKPISATEINQHPLMQWEIATQNELFDFLKFSAQNKLTCQKAKALALDEGCSNLGIEIG